MGKLKQKLYPNPVKARAHRAGAAIQLSQPIIFNSKKVMTVGIAFPQNFYLNIAISYEKEADKLLAEIKRQTDKDQSELPHLDNEPIKTFLAVAMSAIVFGYTSIEMMANSYIISNSTGKKEAYLKQDLGTKLKMTLPKLIGKPSLATTKLWQRFCGYEDLRINIIHPLPNLFYNVDKWSETLVSRLMNGKYKGISDFSSKVFKHFYMPTPSGPVTLQSVQRGLQAKKILGRR
jgi:hypothetical protein